MGNSQTSVLEIVLVAPTPFPGVGSIVGRLGSVFDGICQGDGLDIDQDIRHEVLVMVRRAGVLGSTTLQGTVAPSTSRRRFPGIQDEVSCRDWTSKNISALVTSGEGKERGRRAGYPSQDPDQCSLLFLPGSLRLSSQPCCQLTAACCALPGAIIALPLARITALRGCSSSG